MEIWQAVVLGAVQGFCEFLPVSSSGHLILMQRWLGITDGGLFLDVMLHIGTLIPVFIVFYNDIIGLFKYPFDKGVDIVTKAVSILGEEYVSVLEKGIKDRWIDVYPNKGKRTGGYSSGSYDTNPYILLNYQDKYDDMSTLAHELGHSMHSYYSRNNNPYQYGYYSIFEAEVASTVNELLLAKYVIQRIEEILDKKVVRIVKK